MSTLPACIFVCHVCTWYPRRPEEDPLKLTVQDVQKSQEEFGLKPFRNCVCSWQSWLSTGVRGVWGQNNKAPRPWPCSVRPNQLHVVLPRASPQQAALSPKSC